MDPVSLKDLLEAGCHFGHKTDRWHPKAASFIYQARDGIHIIDLAKTKKVLEQAAQVLIEAIKQNKKVLFVGTKRQASGIVKEVSESVGVAYLTHRWIGGFLTNWEEVHKNLEKIRKLEEEKEKNVWNKYPKHERVKLDRYLRKLKVIYGGVIELYNVPDVVFITDIRKEKSAVREARRKGITTIGIVDTNSDPTQVTYAIPANDDAVGSISFIVKYLSTAVAEGKALYEKGAKVQEKKPEAPVEKKDAKVKESKVKKEDLAEKKVKVEKPKVEKKKLKV